MCKQVYKVFGMLQQAQDDGFALDPIGRCPPG